MLFSYLYAVCLFVCLFVCLILYLEPGKLMARYCIAYDSMKRFLDVKESQSLDDLVSRK